MGERHRAAPSNLDSEKPDPVLEFNFSETSFENLASMLLPP